MGYGEGDGFKTKRKTDKRWSKLRYELRRKKQLGDVING